MSLVVDAHNHIGRRPRAELTGSELVVKKYNTGVDRSVLFPFIEDDFTNDAVKAAVDTCPDRLIVYCAVNPWQPDTAAEFRRCVRAWDLKLHPLVNGLQHSDARLVNPLFVEARDLDIPIIAHGMSDFLSSPPEFAEIARRFPRVRLFMIHMGFFWSVDQAVTYRQALPTFTSRPRARRSLRSQLRSAHSVRTGWSGVRTRRSTNLGRWNAAVPTAVCNRVVGDTMMEILSLV